MRRRLMILATLLAVLMVVGSGGWWVWRTWYAEDQIWAAVVTNDVDRVSLLIKLGAPVDVDVEIIADFDEWGGGKTLHWAAMNDYPNLAELLLKKGADPNAKDAMDKSPLHWAALHNHSAVAKLLLDKGANVDAKDNYDRTPLFYTVLHYKLAVAELLLSNGADPNIKDLNYMSAYDAAFEPDYVIGHAKMADLFKAHMAKQKPATPAEAP